MADFFSDSDEEKAVEELLSKAKDMVILEQVASINCAGFNDSDLPSHLETRFQKLKSFPSASSKPTSLSTKSFKLSPHSFHDPKTSDLGEEKSGEKKLEQIEKRPSTCLKKCPEEKIYLSPSKSFESGSSSPFKKNPQRKLGEKKVIKSPSSSSWDGFSSRSVSPPVKGGCFLCSPKKASSKKKNKENRDLDLGFDWGKHDEYLSDLSNFSSKSQKKLIKKAMEEEEKICREAEKIVKWAKHASARMDVSGIEDELSDSENAKFH